MLNKDERQELEDLRRFKEEQLGKPIQRTFARLEALMMSSHDALISVRAFRIIGDCLLALRDEVINK